MYRFCFVLLCIWGQFPSTSSCLEGLYLEGQFNGGFFALPVCWGGLYLEGLIHGGLIFGILLYVTLLTLFITLSSATHLKHPLNSWFCGNTSSTNSSSASLQNALHGIDTLGILSREDNNIGWNTYLFIFVFYVLKYSCCSKGCKLKLNFSRHFETQCETCEHQWINYTRQHFKKYKHNKILENKMLNTYPGQLCYNIICKMS